MLIEWANKKVQQRQPFFGGMWCLVIKMHSRLTQWYNINGVNYLNAIFGSYRIIKQTWVPLGQFSDCNCRGCLQWSQFYPSFLMSTLVMHTCTYAIASTLSVSEYVMPSVYCFWCSYGAFPCGQCSLGHNMGQKLSYWPTWLIWHSNSIQENINPLLKMTDRIMPCFIMPIIC
jgi:hypothetical protein